MRHQANRTRGRYTPALYILLVCGLARADSDLLFLSSFEQTKAVDYIVMVDTTATMAAEVSEFELTLNSLASRSASLALDYRVIVIARHGSLTNSLCVIPPLSGTLDCNLPPVGNYRFTHVDRAVDSRDALCVEASAYAAYSGRLRADALKIIVVLSDDGVFCTLNGSGLTDANAAPVYEATLFNRAGAPFGSATARRYAFFQIGGLSVFNAAIPSEPHPPTAPVVTTRCPVGNSAGTGYQNLARVTSGLRFSSCETNSYGAYMPRIAEEAAVLHAVLGLPR